MRQLVAALALCALTVSAKADPGQGELQPYLQCAPYARQVSGIQLFGDARSWWDQAQGRYATGQAPREGAVMAFRATERMQAGHVAAVSRVLDSRRVLLDHANWSPVNGRRGQVEKDVLAVDVSSANDWSEVRVWYAPIGDLGTSVWPVEGFIYPDGKPSARPQVIAAAPRRDASKRFLSAFAEFSE